MTHPIVIGQPLPRAEDAWVEARKWTGWILLPGPEGHGDQWARVFRIGLADADALWLVIAEAVRTAPVVAVRGAPGGGINCRVQIRLAMGGRKAPVRTL